MMDVDAHGWFSRRTSDALAWSAQELVGLKRDQRISVVIPARDEAETVADVVGLIRHDLVETIPLVDELVVMDSLSTDATASRAREAGAHVWSVAEVAPELGVWPGKGEALWKSLFVTGGDVIVFVDADLTEWGSHFVTGLVGPMLCDPKVALVKGFYDRVLDGGDGLSLEGGRVTELVARPLLALHWPELSGVVQPLAGEWAIRRECAEALRFPMGYGVEFATLLDVASSRGLDAIAQVDLGRRAHRHQNLHDLGAMAMEIFGVASRRLGHEVADASIVLPHLDSRRRWEERLVPLQERPPVATSSEYSGRHQSGGRP